MTIIQDVLLLFGARRKADKFVAGNRGGGGADAAAGCNRGDELPPVGCPVGDRAVLDGRIELGFPDLLAGGGLDGLKRLSSVTPRKVRPLAVVKAPLPPGRPVFWYCGASISETPRLLS